jgi:hypothetical protein
VTGAVVGVDDAADLLGSVVDVDVGSATVVVGVASSATPLAPTAGPATPAAAAAGVERSAVMTCDVTAETMAKLTSVAAAVADAQSARPSRRRRVTSWRPG